MTKILKKIKVPKTDAVIFKRERSKFWYVEFYIGRTLYQKLHNTSAENKFGRIRKSLKEENYKNALKLAYKDYIDFWRKNEKRRRHPSKK